MLKTLVTYSKQLIYDGLEKQVHIGLLKIPNGLSFNLETSQLEYINELKNLISSEDFDLIISQVSSAKPSKFFPGHYNGSNDLPLKFYLNAEKNYLFIISYGEVQPMRYKIFLEGIWKFGEFNS